MPVMDANGQWVDEDTGETLAPVGGESLDSAQVAAINQPPGQEPSAAPESSLAPDLKTRIRQLSEMQTQKIKEQEKLLKDQLKQVQAYKRAPAQVDLSALLALTDQWTGSKLAQSYKKPPTQQEQFEKGITLENQLLQRKDQLTDNQQKLLESQVKAQLGEATQGRIQDRTNIMRDRLGLAQDTQAAKAGDILDKDSNLKTLTTQKQRIEIGKHTLDSVPTLTPQLFNEIQLDIANAISGGRAAAVSTQKQVEFNSYAIEWQKLKQKLENNPQDIASPGVKKYVREILERLGESYDQNMEARAKQLVGGRQYKSNPLAQQTMEKKAASYSKPKGSPKPGDIVDGHKFLGGDPNSEASWETQ